MNKKKRWLLPHLIDKKIDEYDLTKDGQIDETNKYIRPFKINSYTFQTNSDRLVKYSNNTGINVSSPRGLPLNIDKKPPKNKNTSSQKKKRKIKIEEYQNKKRLPFKNGNRDRNSGVKRRNETFLDEVEPIPNQLLDDLKYRYVNYSVHEPSHYFPINACTHYQKYARDLSNKYYRKRFYQCDNLLRYKMNLKLDTIKSQLSSYEIKEKFTEIIDEPSLANQNNNLLNNELQLDKLLFNSTSNLNLYKRLVKKNEQSINHLVKRRIEFISHIESNQINDSKIELPTKKSIDILQFKFRIINKVVFLESVQTQLDLLSPLIEVNGDCEPSSILIDLKHLIDKENFKIFLITDLTIDNNSQLTVHLNTDTSFWDNKEENEFNFEVYDVLNDFLVEKLSQQNEISVISDLINIFSALIIDFFSTFELSLSVNNVNNEITTKKTIKQIFNENVEPIIGKLSSTNLKLIRNKFENVLNTKQENSFNINTDFLTITSFDCDICCDSNLCYNEMLKLKQCNHSACLSCWRTYLEDKINNFGVKKLNSESKVGCMFSKCNTTVRLNILYCLFHVSIVEKYIRFFINTQINFSTPLNKTDYIACKNPSCHQVIKFNNNKTEIISICECGFMICNLCLQEAHFPATCSNAKAYLQELAQINRLKIEAGLNDKNELYTAIGKHCPTCDHFMEKNGGCNHMTCICGAQYCWECLAAYTFGHLCKTGKKSTKSYDYTYFTRANTRNHRLSNNIMANVEKHRKKRFQTKEDLNSNFHKFYSNLCSNINKNFDDGIKRTSKQFLSKYTKEDAQHLYVKTSVNLIQLHLISEFLYLQFDKKPFTSKSSPLCYSLKPNLINCLKKSIDLTEKVEDIIINRNELINVMKLESLNQQIVKFIINLKHMTINYLNIYN
jgi:hypothetical protein